MRGETSELFFRRMARELGLLLVQIATDERDEFDREVEHLSGMECEDAARTLGVREFRRVAEEAFKNIKRRKRGEGREILAYA